MDRQLDDQYINRYKQYLQCRGTMIQIWVNQIAIYTINKQEHTTQCGAAWYRLAYKLLVYSKTLTGIANKI